MSVRCADSAKGKPRKHMWHARMKARRVHFELWELANIGSEALSDNSSRSQGFRE